MAWNELQSIVQSYSILVYKGALNCSANPDYPAAAVGEVYAVSVAGKIGGASGAVVTAADLLICNTATGAGDHATVGANWDIIQGNVDLSRPGNIGDNTPGTGNFTILTVTQGASVKGTLSVSTISATELVTADPTLDTSTGWTASAGWAIADGKASHTTGNTGALSCTTDAKSTSKLYKIVVNIIGSVVGDGLSVSLGGTSVSLSAADMEAIYWLSYMWPSTAVDIELYLMPVNTTGTLSVTPGSSGTIVADVLSVSVKEVVSTVPELTLKSSSTSARDLEVRAGAGNSDNLAIGYDAGKFNTNASGNVAVGKYAMRNGLIPWYCVAVGQEALANLVGISHSGYYGDNNVAIGRMAGYRLYIGANNIFLGYCAGARQSAVSNLLVVDNQERSSAAEEATNAILYGVMASTPANQTLAINAVVTFPQKIGGAILLATDNTYDIGASGATRPRDAYVAGKIISQPSTSGEAGGFYRKAATASVDVTAAATITIAVNVPSGSKILGCQIRVDHELAAGETWNAAYAGGNVQTIGHEEAVAANTKINVPFDGLDTGGTLAAQAAWAAPVTTDTTTIAITKHSNPGVDSFTAQGAFTAIVYYEAFNAMSNHS